MSRSAASFSRRPPRFKPQPRVLVICEDTKSSKTYLEEAATHYRSYAIVEFSHCGRTDPLGIVEAAAKRRRDFDEVFCVIDRDSHDEQNFGQAVARASNLPDVRLLTSYPCFEFWLLLHFGFTRAPFAPAGKHSAADRVLQELVARPGMTGYKKGDVKGLFLALLPRLHDAIENAVRTLREADIDSQLNPSTSLHELLAKLQELGSLRQF